jgi:phosphoribosylglycinamide formyltransferase-1
MEKIPIAVFVSGRGSNLDAILANIKTNQLDASVNCVISNRSNAGGLDIARQNSIPAIHLSTKQFDNEEQYTSRMLEILATHNVDLIVLAGYLKKVPVRVIQKFKNKIINIHPALLPSFGGKGLYGQYVHKAVIEYGCKVSGATVHIVDEEYDTGAPILQECVAVHDRDTPDTLAARVLKVEHKLLSKAIQLYAEHKITIQHRRVIIK